MKHMTQGQKMNGSSIKNYFLGLFIASTVCLGLAAPAYGATYFVRLDGGSATQCTGKADLPYPGSGTLQNCAFNHPNWALAPQGNNPTKLAGGDTLIIDGSDGAEYMIGFCSPNTNDTSKCGSSWPGDCYMRSIPSGPDPLNPTRILGKGWDQGCSSPPQLWANERLSRVINMENSDNVEIQCLEITDHSDCQQFGPNACNRDSKPYGKWGITGMRATDSENVYLKNINIHGMAYRGILAGRIKDWTIEDTSIVANSFVGWDGDIGADVSANSGTILFNRVKILYSGCGETYPGLQPYNCYSQDQGGYGDGIGTHKTGGDWIFTNSDISHNVSDGLDLLYHNGNGTITIKRSRFEGNAGNQVKVATNTLLSDSILIGNCAYFNNNPITWNSSSFNNCRAGGNTLAVSLNNTKKVSIYNTTFTSNGDVIFSSGGSYCEGDEIIESRNNIFLGGDEYHSPGDKSELYWAGGEGGNGAGACGQIKLNDDYSVIWNTKRISTDCNGKEHAICKDPQFKQTPVNFYSGNSFDVNLKSTSPAISKALKITGKSSLDYNFNDRGDVWDIGAIEYEIAASGQTCAQDINYCLTQAECVAGGYYWYNNKCNVNPEPLPTCAQDVLYCATSSDCAGQGHYWYNNVCHLEPEPVPTCDQGIQYCLTSAECTAYGHYWYNNTCNAQPKPLTCADGIQYCTTSADCTAYGHYWYNNTCNARPKPLTCADGIQYCTTSADCTANGHFW